MPRPTKRQVPPPVVPHLTVDDAAAAIEFYKKAFGAVEIARHAAPDGKKIMHAAVLVFGAPIMLNDDFPEYSGRPSTPTAFGGSPVTIHLNVPDVDAAWQQAIEAGATITMALADQFWGDRYGALRDPHGHQWSMATARNKPSQEQIQKAARKAFAKMPLARAKGAPARAAGKSRPAAASGAKAAKGAKAVKRGKKR